MPLRPPVAVWVVGLVTLALAPRPARCGEPPSEPESGHIAARTGFDRVSSPLVRTDLRLESAASCAATVCHGGPRAGVAQPAAARGSEYALWLQNDPHALSWRTFCSDASVAIMERLNIMESGRVVDTAGFDNCLACHNSTRQFAEPRAAEHLREGIGCSGCHGPAGRWRSTHNLEQWNAYTAVEDGFVPNGNMLARARMCAACHIGDRDRDMNHDMIAAGHPALHYEFATFHQRQPKHWRDRNQDDTARYEASQWLAGQLAALDASLVLLEARADRARSVSRWPELSAFECSTCHQQLRLPVADAALPLRATAATFSPWNRFGVEELLRLRRAEGKSGPEDRRLAEALERLTLTMQTVDGSGRDAKLAARQTRLALDAWLGSTAGLTEIQQFTSQRLLALVLSAGRQDSHLQSWESAAQLYLAAVAGRQAWSTTPEKQARPLPQLSTPQLSTPLGSEPNSAARRLRNALMFQEGTHTPSPDSAATLRAAWLDTLRAIGSVGSGQPETIPLWQDANPRPGRSVP